MVKIPQGWTGDAKKIEKLFTFPSFVAAMDFMVEVGLYCEKADHHPTWKNTYDKIWVELSTHDSGGVTEKDIALATYMDAAAERFAAKKK